MNHITTLREIQAKVGGLTTDDLVPERLKRKPISGKTLKEAIKQTFANHFYETKSWRAHKDCVVHVDLGEAEMFGVGASVLAITDYVLLQALYQVFPTWVQADWKSGELLDFCDRYRIAMKVRDVDDQVDLFTGNRTIVVQLRIFCSKYRQPHEAITPQFLAALKCRLRYYEERTPENLTQAREALGNAKYLRPIIEEMERNFQFPSLGSMYTLWKMDRINFFKAKYRHGLDWCDIPDSAYLWVGLLLKRYNFPTRSWCLYGFNKPDTYTGITEMVKDVDMRFVFIKHCIDLADGWLQWMREGHEEPPKLPGLGAWERGDVRMDWSTYDISKPTLDEFL